MECSLDCKCCPNAVASQFKMYCTDDRPDSMYTIHVVLLYMQYFETSNSAIKMFTRLLLLENLNQRKLRIRVYTGIFCDFPVLLSTLRGGGSRSRISDNICFTFINLHSSGFLLAYQIFTSNLKVVHDVFYKKILFMLP